MSASTTQSDDARRDTWPRGKPPRQDLRGEAVEGRIERAESLTSEDRQQMLELMQWYYAGVVVHEFARDLSEKHWVITLRSECGRIWGFSTQVLLPIPGHPDSMALFSGDTVVAEPYRSNHLLAGLWGSLALEQIDLNPDKRVFWFLISKGYKTYRYLPLFFYEFYPRRNWLMPTDISSRIGKLAQGKFGDRYDAELGIVRAQSDSCRLRPDVAPVDIHRMRNPDVAFFVEVNPQHARGDELCCMAPLRRSNFTTAAYRVIEAASKSTGL